MSVKQVNNRDEHGRFISGKSGNPKGRPLKDFAISDILNDILDEEIEGSSRKRIILKGVVQRAYNGERWAVQFIADRTEGKPEQKIKVEDVLSQEEMDAQAKLTAKYLDDINKGKKDGKLG